MNEEWNSFKLCSGYHLVLLKCDTIARPTRRSPGFVGVIPINEQEGSEKDKNMPFSQGFASSTEASTREDVAREVEAAEVPDLTSSGPGETARMGKDWI